MIMMKPRKTTKTTIAIEVRELGSNCSFLDVLRETCTRDGGRYTLSVEAGSAAYAVLVDRGGPFNAIGGGASGSRALVGACQLRSGRCTITPGWPVEQPLYQPGLDLTMKGLVDGVVEASNLPRHRGVDSLRNAEWREAYVVQPAPETTWPSQVVAGPILSQPPAPAAAAAPATVVPATVVPATVVPATVVPALVVPATVVPAPVAPATAVPAPETPAAEASTPAPEASTPAPGPTPQPNTEQKMAWKPVGSASAWLPASEVPDSLPAAVRPAVGKVHATDGDGPAKQMATRAILWLVECDDSSQHTFDQAAAMARRSLTEGLQQMARPFRRDLDNRITRIREDWEHSGEVAAKAVRKNRSKATAKPVDPDREFRLH